MVCYVVGACALLWNLLSAIALRISIIGEVSIALCTYAALLGWFICEYMCLEVMPTYYFVLT